MACGGVENCSDQLCLAPALFPQIEYLSELDQFLDYNSNKKRFSWNGNADNLGKFIEEDEEDAPKLKGFVQKGCILNFWPIFIFCRIELIFGRLTCFDMKSIVP